MNKKDIQSSRTRKGGRAMSASAHKREEIRGTKGEASPMARARGKTEVTHGRNVTPQPKEERGVSKKVAERHRKAEGK